MKSVTLFFLTLVFSLAANAAPKAPQKLAIEESATLPAFAEFSQSCKAGKLNSEKTDQLAHQFATRMSEWDVSALLVMRIHCAKGKTADMLIKKLSQDAVMKHPKSLIQAMTEEKISHELMIKIAANNSLESKNCSEDCIKKETLTFEQRIEKISNLELTTQERETRDRFLSEMRLAFGKLKEKKLR